MYSVLIADDDPFILEGLRHIVDWASLGLDIVGAFENGRLAQRFMQENHVDVLLTDIRMPEMDGLELIEWVRERGLDVRCVVLSSYDDYPYLHRALKLGIENYLLKSINEDELAETLQAAVDKLDRERIYRDDALENVLLDNILLRWMTNRIDRIEVTERFGMLGLGALPRAFQVSALRCLSAPGLQPASLGMLSTHADSPFPKAFRDLDGDTIIIMADPPSAFDADGLLSHLEVETCERWFLAQGGASAQGFESACRSYDQAKRLLGYALLCPEVRHIHWDESLGVRLPAPQWDLAEIRNQLLSCDTTAINQHIATTFSQTCSPASHSPEHLTSYSIRVAQMLHDTLAAREAAIPEQMLTDDAIFASVRALRTRDALQNWLMEMVGRCLAQLGMRQGSVSPVIERAIQYVDSHYADNLSLKILANLFHANPAYLGRIFKTEMGEPFSIYLNRIRIGHARHMLLNTHLPVGVIAQQAGFSSTNYFVNVFRKYVHCYPRQYRREHGS